MSPPPHEVEIGGFVCGRFTANDPRIYGWGFWKIIGRVFDRVDRCLYSETCPENTTVIRRPMSDGVRKYQAEEHWCAQHGLTFSQILDDEEEGDA